MTRTELAIASSALLALTACSAAAPGPPQPHAVTPAFAFAAAPTPIALMGEGFTLQAVQEVNAQRSHVGSGYRVWIGALELEDVRWIDAGRLGATVPAGLAPGRYDVVVQGPFGRGALPGAFGVLAGSAPVLRVALDAPARVSVGQRFAISARVENGGDAPLAAVTPALDAGAVAVREAPAAAATVLAAGETAVFTWQLDALSPGEVPVSARALASDPRLPSPHDAVEGSAAGSLRVDAAARLEAELLATPALVNAGQELSIRMAVRNTGEATALDVTPGSLAQVGDGLAAPGTGPFPPSASIPGGSTAWFEWHHTATGVGMLTLSGGAAGADANSTAPVHAVALPSAPVRVQHPAALAARFVNLPSRVNVGQTFRAAVEIANGGDSTAVGVGAAISLSPLSSAIAGPAPQALDVPGGGTATVERTVTAVALGTATFVATIAGTDATDGRAVAGSAPAQALVIERPAELVATLAIPATLTIGLFTATMTVENVGDAAAHGVLPGALALQPGSTAATSLVAAPTDPVSVPGGGSATFTWSYRAETFGTLQLTGAAAGADANDGGARSAGALSAVATVREGARVIASNPFLDGSPFAFVTGHGGQIYVGPNRTGSALARMDVDGGSLEPLTLSFPRDAVGTNTHDNSPTPPAPYRSIGHTGCQTDSDTDACGPDNEDGRGLLTSVAFGGEEWLVLGGARSGGDLDYVYLSRGTASPLEFRYTDLSSALGGNTRGISAALASGDRLYLGFPDNGGNRPYGLALLAPPGSPGLDAVLGNHVLELNLGDAFKTTGGSYASVAMVDTIAELGGRIYFFNNVGCIVSTIPAPSTKDHFVSCSPPLSAAYDPRQSIEPVRQFDLEPRERAWPQAVVWRGRLHAIRNTYAGPQLWACDPAGGTNPITCEPADWRLVAADAANLTRFGHSTATAATLLVATPNHLYMGLDDGVRGVHVFRTSVDRPALSDFTGREGCTAGTAGCQGIGGDGFGEPGTLVRIFDAKAIPTAAGPTDVYLTAGDGSAAVRVVLVAD